MDSLNQPHGRRTLIAGAAGLGLASVIGGSLVRAQATPEPSGGTTTDTTTQDTDRAAEAATRYDDFVAKLATNLGNTDSAAVDTAIRASLTDIVDERLAAGEISANDATAAKTAIASSAAPILGLFAAARYDGGSGRFGGHGRPGDFGPGGFGPGGFGSGGRPGDDETGDDTDPADTDTTDATPVAAV
jgi:hypothetical protein